MRRGEKAIAPLIVRNIRIYCSLGEGERREAMPDEKMKSFRRQI